MNFDDAVGKAANDVRLGISQGGGVIIKTVKGPKNLPEAVVVGIHLNPALCTEFINVVARWAETKKFMSSIVSIQ